jgi:hypothetical protein
MKIRTHRIVKLIAAALTAATLCVLPGCNLLEFPMYVLFGSSTVTVKAEYKGLEETRTALVIMTDSGTDFEFPYLRLDLALMAGTLMKEKIDELTLVDAETIIRFQRNDLDWYRLAMTELGKRFDAQRIVYLDVIRFSILEDNSIGLLRGRAEADVRVYDMTSDKPEKPVYQTAISITYPEQVPIPLSDTAQQQVMQRTLYMFGTELTHKFVDHKEERKKE